MRGIVASQMCVGFRIAEIIDGDNLNVVLLSALIVGTEYIAANAAIAIDGDFDGHGNLLKRCKVNEYPVRSVQH